MYERILSFLLMVSETDWLLFKHRLLYLSFFLWRHGGNKCRVSLYLLMSVSCVTELKEECNIEKKWDKSGLEKWKEKQ